MASEALLPPRPEADRHMSRPNRKREQTVLAQTGEGGEARGEEERRRGKREGGEEQRSGVRRKGKEWGRKEE